MPRNGAGSYSLPESAFVFDTIISETTMNSNLADIATALTASIAKDGQTNPTANLPMNSKKHTGVAVGTVRTEYADVGSVADGDYVWCGTATGTANAVALTPSPAFTALVTGMKLRWKASSSTNTGAATAVISGLTSIALEIDDAALSAGEHEANKYYEGLYDGTAFQIQKISAGVTFTGFSGLEIVRKTADETVNNSSTPQDDDHLFTSLAINERVFFRLALRYESSEVADFRAKFTAPSGAALKWNSFGGIYFLADGTTEGGISEAATTLLRAFGGKGIAANLTVDIWGSVLNGGNAGNLQFQWAQNTAEASNTKVKEDSILQLWRI